MTTTLNRFLPVHGFTSKPLFLIKLDAEYYNLVIYLWYTDAMLTWSPFENKFYKETLGNTD